MKKLDNAIASLATALATIKDITGAHSLYATDDTEIMLQVQPGIFNIIAKGHKVETIPTGMGLYNTRCFTRIGKVQVFYVHTTHSETKKDGNK